MPPQQAAASGSRGSQSGEQWQGPCAQEPMWPVFPGGQCQQGRGPATGHVELGPQATWSRGHDPRPLAPTVRSAGNHRASL